MNDNKLLSQLQSSMVDIAVESWRFARLFYRLLEKMDAGERTRYINQHRYYLKKLDENLKLAGVSLVSVEGQQFDTGMAATALNVEDFSPDDTLVVEQMVEPIIMGKDGLIKTGTVMLKKG